MGLPKVTNMHCPMCATPWRLSEEASIKWDAERKEFEVFLKGNCFFCGISEEVAIKSLPLTIANESSCSCGGTLVLSDHSLTVKNGDLEFRATYKCPSCSKADERLLSRLISGLKKVWSDTTSVEVGPSGVKFEKRSSD
jgi:endogenous inhibitor of DNA gyrase (YacG/DUF329 family)